MHDFYFFANSHDSIGYFPNNNPGNYRVKLEKPIRLEGQGWHVGLCEISGVAWDVVLHDTVYIMCNLSSGLLLPSNQEGLLRVMPVYSRAKTYVEYAHVVYTPVQTHFIDVIELSLKVNGFTKSLAPSTKPINPKNGAKPSTLCVLHFVKKL
jgi:hypothetical protein